MFCYWPVLQKLKHRRMFLRPMTDRSGRVPVGDQLQTVLAETQISSPSRSPLSEDKKIESVMIVIA